MKQKHVGNFICFLAGILVTASVIFGLSLKIEDANRLLKKGELDKCSVYIQNVTCSESDEWRTVPDTNKIDEIKKLIDDTKIFRAFTTLDLKMGSPYDDNTEATVIFQNDKKQYVFHLFDVREQMSLTSTHRDEPLIYVAINSKSQDGRSKSQWYCILEPNQYALLFDALQKYNGGEIVTDHISAWKVSEEVTTVAKETNLDEIDIPWYETSPYDNLPKGTNAEELLGTHHFSTENDFEYTSPSAEQMNGNAPKELISSHYHVSLPNNLYSEFVDIIARIDDNTYVNVTDLIEWNVEDDVVAYVYDGRIMANEKGSTVVTASFAGFEISIDVVVEETVDLKAGG